MAIPKGLMLEWVRQAAGKAQKRGEVSLEIIEQELKEEIDSAYGYDPELTEYGGALEAKKAAIQILRNNPEKFIKPEEVRELQEEVADPITDEANLADLEYVRRLQKKRTYREMLRQAQDHAEFHTDPEEGDHWMREAPSFRGRRK